MLVTDNDNDGDVMMTMTTTTTTMKMKIRIIVMAMMMMMLMTIMTTMMMTTMMIIIIPGQVKLVAFRPKQPERPKPTVYILKARRKTIPSLFYGTSSGVITLQQVSISQVYTSYPCDAAMLTVRRAINSICILLSSGFYAIVIQKKKFKKTSFCHLLITILSSCCKMMANIRYSRAEAGATGTLKKASSGLRLKIETQKTVDCGMPRRSLEYFF